MAALQIDSESFFPNYNLGVLKAMTKDYEAAKMYLSKALSQAETSHEKVY